MAHSKLIAVALMGLALAGCKTAANLACVPLHHYTVAERQAAAKQYKAAMAQGGFDAVLRLVDDYGIERDAIRACIKRRK